MATIKEIAELAGVSRRTVDRVINHRGSVKPDTEEKIRKIIEELSYTPNAAGRSLAAHKKKLRLLFCSTKGTYAPIYHPIRLGARQKATDLNEYGVTTDFLTIDREHPYTREELRHMIDHLDCDGIAISPVDIPGITEIIEWAEKKQIPMVFYNVDQPDCSRLSFVGCDYVKAGRIAAGLAAFASGDEGEICILSSKVANLPSFEDRVAGFRDELSTHYPHMEIVENTLLDGDQFDCYDTIRKIIAGHPDIRIIYLVNPGDYSACHAISKAVGDRKIRIITNDLMEEQIPMLQSGLISATIDQEPLRQGSLPLEILFNHLAMGIQPPSDPVYTRLSIIIGQNSPG